MARSLNISSIGVFANVQPVFRFMLRPLRWMRFSCCLVSAEVHSTQDCDYLIYMPFAGKYSMIAPTKIYKYVPTLSPEETADLIATAIVNVQIAITWVVLRQLHAIAPQTLTTS